MGEITKRDHLDSTIGPSAFDPARSPYHVYLARLSKGSRPAMADSLRQVARITSGGRVEADAFPWHQLRYQHVQAIRTALVETVSTRTGKPLAPSTVNKALSALRGVLKEAWRLGLMKRRGPGPGDGRGAGEGLEAVAGSGAGAS